MTVSSNTKKKSFVKIALITLAVIVLILIVGSFTLPSIAKKYIEKNDVAWIGREVSIGKISVNLFQCKIKIHNASIKESNGKTTFLTFDELLININFWDAIQNKISTDQIKLTNLSANIIQNGNQFNFSDLTKSTPSSTEESEPILFNLKNININNARIHYLDTQINSKVVLDSITVTNKSFTSKDSIFNADVAIHQPEKGWVRGDVAYNLHNNNYKVNSAINNWQISPFKNYVTTAIQLSEFSGMVNADLMIAGNTQTDYIESNGVITVTNFNLIDPEEKPLLSVKELLVDINAINSKEKIYDFNNITVNGTHVSYEYLPNGDNFSKWLVNTATESTTKNTTESYVSPFEMLSVYIYDMTKEYIFKSYTAKKIELSDFNLKFYDYTLEDPFHMDLQHLNIVAENIKPENKYANFHTKGKINATGTIEGDIAVSRSGVENMTVNMNIDGLFLNRFSPYGRFYTAHRFMEGISSFKNKSVIKDSYLTSTNTVQIKNIKLSKKDKTQNGYSLPMKLAVALIKDNKGDINLDIPIEGPVNDPEYKFGKVIWQIIKNIFTKIVSSPVKALANTFKTDINDLKHIYFDNGQIGLSPKQKKPLDAIAKILVKKPVLKLTLNHLYNVDYEMDAIALKEAKLQYLKQSNINLDKSIPIGKHAFDLSSTDPEFLNYLKTKTLNYDETISIPENARRLIGKEQVYQKLVKVAARQKELIKSYLINEKTIAENRFKIVDASSSNEAINQSIPKFETVFGVVE